MRRASFDLAVLEPALLEELPLVGLQVELEGELELRLLSQHERALPLQHCQRKRALHLDADVFAGGEGEVGLAALQPEEVHETLLC